MPIIGAFIKKAIELKHAFDTDDTIAGAQEQQLIHLLQEAKSTSFGIYYGFEEILESDDPISAFQQAVPIFTYDRINERWWKQQRLMPDITWPGKPDYFATTSGTTSQKSKRIPVTQDMLQCFRAVSLAQVTSLVNFDFPAEFFEKKILALGSSIDLEENEEGGFKEGEISGIHAGEAPDWFDYFYKPGKDIARIDDWDERIAHIVDKAPEWDVGGLAGIPSWVLMMLKNIIKHYQLETIHDIWPGLQIYTSGGVAFEPFRASFKKIFARPVHIMDTYLASEGFFAFNARPETEAMQMAYQEQMFFEFIPFDSSGFDDEGRLLEKPKVVTLSQVESGKDYALLVSTPAGTWRYLIEDTVRFTDVEKAEFLITGRTKHFLNVVGSQLSEEKLNSAIRKLSEYFNTEINEFAVAALQDANEDYYHQWVISTSRPIENEEAAEKLDHILQDMNKNYGVARNKALKSIQVLCVAKEQIYEWLETSKKKGGQVKFPKVMPPDKMRDLVEFLS